MKLLVAIDSSPGSKVVVDEVARRPWPSGTAACVLHVVDCPQPASSASLLPGFKQLAGLIVKKASDELAKAGLQTSANVLEGRPRIAIAEYAKKSRADLVLVGSHGASGLARFLLGSVAQAALRRSPCSVEIVRRPTEEFATTSTAMKILIGVDGSHCSTTAVRSVAQRPWPPNTQMRLISVIPLVIPLGAMMSPTLASLKAQPDIVMTLQKEARSWAQEAVVHARQILSEAGIKTLDTEALLVGDARQVILDLAKRWGADLIVVGSHGYRGLDRFILGSVSEAVAIHAHSSVEVVRR